MLGMYDDVIVGHTDGAAVGNTLGERVGSYVSPTKVGRTVGTTLERYDGVMLGHKE